MPFAKFANLCTALRTWRTSLGPKAEKYVLHGLRKFAIIRLAEAGCSDAEIQAVTNQSTEMVAYYRARASLKAQGSVTLGSTASKLGWTRTGTKLDCVSIADRTNSPNRRGSNFL